jgi:hypothetical protein
MRNVIMGRFGKAVVTLGACASFAGCANTAGGGGAAVTPTDTVSGTDTTGGTDATPGTDTGGGQDVPLTGKTFTVAEVQAQSVPSAKCDVPPGIENTLKSVAINGLVIAAAVATDTKGNVTVFVQSKGGGPNSGIVLSGKTGGPLDPLKVGDAIDVVGEVKEFFCLTELEPKVVIPSASATELPVAVTVDVALIGTKATQEQNRTYESAYVSLENAVVSGLGDPDKSGNPHAIWVGKSDSDKQLLVANGAYKSNVYVIGADKKTPNYKVGQKLNIQGFLTYSFSAWQVVPSAITVQP